MASQAGGETGQRTHPHERLPRLGRGAATGPRGSRRCSGSLVRRQGGRRAGSVLGGRFAHARRLAPPPRRQRLRHRRSPGGGEAEGEIAPRARGFIENLHEGNG